MFCPACGAQNISEARFCRLCGVKLRSRDTSQLYQSQPSYEKSIRKLFMGIAFLIVAIVSLFASHGFMWWLMFPAIPMISKGINGIFEARQAIDSNSIQPALIARDSAPQAPPALNGEFRARETGELDPPPSVTENTTRLFDS